MLPDRREDSEKRIQLADEPLSPRWLKVLAGRDQDIEDLQAMRVRHGCFWTRLATSRRWRGSSSWPRRGCTPTATQLRSIV